MTQQLSGAHIAYRLILIQFVVVSALSVMLLLWDVKTAYSMMVGGIICVVPNFSFARTVFAHRGARAAQQILVAFWIGEASKLILSSVLFYSVLKWLPVDVLPLFMGYLVALVAFWVAPLAMTKRIRTA